MKRNAVIYSLLVFLLLFSFVWMIFEKRPVNTLEDYEKVLRDGVPEDMRLTIYYMDPTILTRLPVRTLEDLLSYPQTKTIQADALKLVAHRDLLKELDASCLQPITEESGTEPIIGYLRLVYVLERENGKKLVEVKASDLINGNSIIVNGLEVENNPIFYELIDPFLNEVDRNILARTFDVNP